MDEVAIVVEEAAVEAARVVTAYVGLRLAVGLACAAEVGALTTRRYPTVTQLCRRFPWLGPIVLVSLAVDIYWPAVRCWTRDAVQAANEVI